MRPQLSILASLLLLACASKQVWTHDEKDPAAFARDNARCQALRAQVLGAAGTYKSTGPYDFGGSFARGHLIGLANSTYRDCMVGEGWRLEAESGAGTAQAKVEAPPAAPVIDGSHSIGAGETDTSKVAAQIAGEQPRSYCDSLARTIDRYICLGDRMSAEASRITARHRALMDRDFAGYSERFRDPASGLRAEFDRAGRLSLDALRLYLAACEAASSDEERIACLEAFGEAMVDQSAGASE